jgi:hypothetical protein
MINSLKDLVNESILNQDGLVDEMGVKKPERLSGSHIGRSRQETVARQAELAGRPQLRSYPEVAADLTRALKAVRRLDIIMERPNNSRYYYPKFPQPIVDLMTELKSLDNSRFRSDFGRWRDVYPGDDEAIHFRTEGPSDFQRSHFPNGGIPPALRGAGLGFKLYRTLLKEATYISSNPSGTTEKDKAWGSMLSYKSNPDGTPSDDDANAVIGPGNWMAMEKSLSDQVKIELVNNFIDRVIGPRNTQPDRFDMDDELLAIMPNDILAKLNRDYLNSLVESNRIPQERLQQIMAAVSDVQRREEERAEREATERRERAARQEAETRQRLADKIQRFGADPDADWNVGDFIVVKSYLYDASYDSLPIRRVVENRNGTYIAVKISDAIRIDAGEITPSQANDNRTTSDKSNWVKVNLEQIPDLDNINLTRAEKVYIENQLNPAEIERRRAEAETRNREQVDADRAANAGRAVDPGTYAELPQNGAQLKQMVVARPGLAALDTLKKIRTGDFAKFIVLDPSQKDALRNAWGVPVYAAIEKIGRAIRSVENPQELISSPRGISLINVVTGEVIQGPFTGLGLTAYTLGPVSETDKLSTRAGDHYYIANHMNNWGIFAKCDYTTRNTANQPFIYLRTFGGAERSTPVRLDLLRKIVGAPIEL